MTNHCSNYLTVSGSKDDLSKFKELFLLYDGDGATYNNTVTLPIELNSDVSPLPMRDGETQKQYDARMRHYKKKFGHTSWYGWRIANWGTKWDIYDFYLNDNQDTSIDCSFNSAWSPPTEWLIKTAKQFQSLTFVMSYMEEGMCFCGKITIRDGFDIEDFYGDPVHEDENGNKVEWDDENHVWLTADGVKIDDEDFSPIQINPYE